MSQDKLFREKALAKLSSPEQLDQMIIITDRKGWIGLLAIGLILITSLIWSFAGDIPVTINGTGILIPEGGIHEIACFTTGMVKEITVKSNEVVEKDQVIAKLYNPEMEYELQSARNQLEKLKEDKSEKNIERIKDMEAHIEYLAGRVAVYSEIKSQSRGVITSIRVMEDDYIEEGTTIATMEHLDKPLVSVLFVSDEEAKKIEIGMDVQVSPSVVKKEENGFIRGKVIHVSNYPTTRQQMTSILENEQMIDYFMAGNIIPLIIMVKLDSDPASKSGYKWSSGKEPDFKITSGTICNASIIITQMHPISVIFPYTN